MSVRHLLWKKKGNFSWIFFLIISACSPKPYYKDKTLVPPSTAQKNFNEPLYTLYLIGDAGNAHDSSSVLKMLSNFLSKEKGNCTTIFLGDNIYFYGLPEESSKDYPDAKSRLDAQIKAVKSYNGQAIFVPGNHDWALDGKDGWKAIKRQQQYVENHLGEDSFYPKNGCPGPEVVKENKDFVLIIYDSQWWIHPHEKPDSTLCTYGSKSLFIQAMKNLIEKYQDKTVVVMAHHPFFSCSSHGGRFTLKEHLFPLRFLNSKLYIPLPIIGSGMVLLRYLVNHPSDSWNKNYKALKNQLLPIFESHPKLIYVSGHDHNLQYRVHNGVHHVISGSGSKISEVGKSKKWEFTYSEYGLAILKFYNEKTVDLEFWSVDKSSSQGKLVYSKTIIP